MDWVCEQSWLWWINEAGILLEIIGALVIVRAAFTSRNEIKDVRDTYDADLATKLRDIIASQAFTELKGFGLLAIGLLGQFIGGFQ